GPEVADSGGATESIARGGTEIDEAYLGAAGREAGSSNRTSHADDYVFGMLRVNVEWQFVEQHIFSEELTAPIFAQQRLLGKIQVSKFPTAEINAQDFAHVAAGQSTLAIDRKEVRVIWIRGRHYRVSLKAFCS